MNMTAPIMLKIAVGAGLIGRFFAQTSYAAGYAAGGGSAPADFSIAIGQGAAAVGENSLALGTNAYAESNGSVICSIFGYAANESIAFQEAIASGPWSFAAIGASALGMQSIAFGDGSVASGSGAVAMGTFAVALGNYSFSAGSETVAATNYSSAFGLKTIANFQSCFVVGQYNDPETGANPLFIVGNGEELGNAPWYLRHNAFTVYQDGKATFRGVVHVAAGGDIPMFVP